MSKKEKKPIMSEEDEQLRVNLRGIMEEGFGDSDDPLPLNINLIIREDGKKDGKLLLPMRFKFWSVSNDPVETKWKPKAGEPNRPTYRYILEDEDGTKFSMLSSGVAIYAQAKLIPIGKTIILDANKQGWKFFRL